MDTDGKSKRGWNWKTSSRHVWFLCLILAAIGSLGLMTWSATSAASVLTIEPLTWDVVGLDAADVNNGPNTFLVGARVCNPGMLPIANVVTTFAWDTENPYINLVGPNQQSVVFLRVQSCQDFYYQVEVNRSNDAFNSSRGYHISATTGDEDTISTPLARRLTVKPLSHRDGTGSQIPQPQQTAYVGETIQYVTHSNGLEGSNQQLAHLLNYPPGMVRLKSIAATYTEPSGARNDSPYANACGWDADSASATYGTCAGPEQYPGGSVGGSTVTTYTVEILSAGQITLNQAVYALSGETFYYQPGSPAESLVIVAQPISTPTPTVSAPTASPTLTRTSDLMLQQTTTITPTVTITPTITPTTPTPTTPTPTTPTPTTPTPTTPTPTTVVVTNAVSPTEARANQNLTFTVRVTNNTGSDITNASLRTTFPTQLSITNASTTRGTQTTNATDRSVTVAIGTLTTGQDATVTITTRVNSNVTTTTSLTNVATLTYTLGNNNLTATSNTVSFRALGSTALPGTGGIQLDREPPGPFWPAVLIGVLLGLLGFAAIGGGFMTRRRLPLWTGWFARMGLLLMTAGLLFSLVGWGATLRGTPLDEPGLSGLPISNLARSQSETPLAQPTFAQPSVSGQEPQPEFEQEPDLLETLPDYPIPTPQITVTPGADGEQLDTSAINRIMIPAINLDTVVKYVPFDGYTWLISGLQQEIAWLGQTSWPGLGGNTALAGHVTLRNGAKGPFWDLAGLKPGNIITIYTDQFVYTYQVRESQLVAETEISVLQTSDAHQLTLITCATWDADVRYYLERLVVFADLAKVESLAETTAGN